MKRNPWFFEFANDKNGEIIKEEIIYPVIPKADKRSILEKVTQLTICFSKEERSVVGEEGYEVAIPKGSV